LGKPHRDREVVDDKEKALSVPVDWDQYSALDENLGTEDGYKEFVGLVD